MVVHSQVIYYFGEILIVANTSGSFGVTCPLWGAWQRGVQQGHFCENRYKLSLALQTRYSFKNVMTQLQDAAMAINRKNKQVNMAT
jgi:hypothetical protein